MCILFIAKNSHPDYPLIIAANRDEYFARPTEAPHWWPENPQLFAGKDVQAGGTWMGHNRQQRAHVLALGIGTILVQCFLVRPHLAGIQPMLEPDGVITMTAISRLRTCPRGSLLPHHQELVLALII